ncbi:MAG: MlaD family protein [Thermoanaerobaculaceae bacterium]
MLERDPKRLLKVGLFTGALLILLGVSIFLIGKKQGMFIRHVRFQAQFQDVAGLVPGAQVWLNGVVVGVVENIDLPEDPSQRKIKVTFRIRRSLAGRIRGDSRVRIRTIGLLGDRYLELSSGSPVQPPLPEGSSIPALEPTNIAEALSQGGEAMGNIVAITSSLRRILEKMEQGQGLLGVLVNEPIEGPRFARQLTSTLDHLSQITQQVQKGQGLLGKLVISPEGERLFAQLAESVASAHRVLTLLESDLIREDSVLTTLLRNPKAAEQVEHTLTSLAQASQALAAASQELANGQGTLPRLLRDQKFADDFLEDLKELTHNLASVAKKLDQGKGSAGQFLNDPKLYQDLENVVRGVQKSSLLRWFIRNRREAGELAVPTKTPGGS